MSDLRYFNLSIRAPARLALMRKVSADWRKARAYGMHSYAAAFGLASRGFNTSPLGARIPVITSFGRESMPVRDIRFADDVDRSIDHNGWFADCNGYGDSGVVRGIVARLPHGRFLSGYHWSDNDEYVILTDEVFTDEHEAARDADHEAARYAEDLRDDDARFQTMTDAEGLCESKVSDLRDAWNQYRAAWCAFLTDPMRHAKTARKAREWVTELISDLRATRREFESARDAYERG